MRMDGRYHAAVPEAGQVIGGKYRLRRPVGEGAMASIWSAVHETLGRPVAVKFIHSRAMSEVAAARFMREAKIAASVQHRFVVDIFDFGKTQQGEPFMVMELLNGETLADRMMRGPPIPAQQFVRMMENCLTGLEAVHDAGIVHRDLKPENVFVIHDGDGGFPKLLDFGISRVDDSVIGERANKLTREGAVLGTPWYMSPEQVRGKADLDHRTDLYSVGVILYEVLTGTLPFDARTVGDLMVMIATEPAVALEHLRRDLPVELSDVVAKAMAKNPAKRFQTAKEFRTALRAVRANLGEDAFTMVSLRPPSEPPQKLASEDLVPARPVTGGVARAVAPKAAAPAIPTEAAETGEAQGVDEPGLAVDAPTPAPASVPARSLGELDTMAAPAAKPRRAGLLVAGLALALGGVGVGLSLSQGTDPGEDVVTTEPVAAEPAMEPTPDPLPAETADAGAVVRTEPAVPDEPADLEEPEPAVEEPAVTRRVRRRRPTMRAASVEAFDDPGF